MSRIGKQPIPIPEGVTVTIAEGKVSVKGPKGTLQMVIPMHILVSEQEKNIVVSLQKETKQSKKMWGTMRSIISNMIAGVVKEFEKKLEIEGVGYRANLQGKDLELLLGFSHPVKVKAPEGITFVVEKNTITVSGISKEGVGRIAAEIRALKKPEPYKGKGIHYVGEIIRRKAGKKAMSAG